MFMDPGAFFLLLLFVLTVAHLVSLKLCAGALDHRSAPLFIGGWTLVGLLVVAPFYGHQLLESLPLLSASPWLFALLALKGGALYLLLVQSQDLMKMSLSSRHYVTPLAVGFIAICNAALGEELNAAQWFSALGLCALAAGFLLFGHAADLDRQGRMIYARLVALSVFIAAINQLGISELDWYTVLLLSNLVLLGLALGLSLRDTALIKQAALHPMAIFAGILYAATELVKFYQQVTINPVTAVTVTQAMTKPVILILSAVIWKERTLKEQMIWGAAAFVVVLPMFLAS